MAIVLLMLLIQYTCAQHAKDAITGIWINEEQTAKIEIFNDENSFSGKLIWIDNERDENGQYYKDIKNPNPEKRDQTIKGMVIISGLNYNGKYWENGEIYSPKMGETANCKILIISPTEMELTVAKGFIKKTKTWRKIN